jgi:hypothetical protein
MDWIARNNQLTVLDRKTAINFWLRTALYARWMAINERWMAMVKWMANDDLSTAIVARWAAIDRWNKRLENTALERKPATAHEKNCWTAVDHWMARSSENDL